jgi:hypothetical protein
VKNIWENDINSNIKIALAYLEKKDRADEEGFLLDDILEFHRNFPVVFYPAFRLQTAIMRSSLGD